jgi:hypothetical protein
MKFFDIGIVLGDSLQITATKENQSYRDKKPFTIALVALQGFHKNVARLSQETRNLLAFL